MSNSNYFNQALHDMVFETACGAAIKRLADKRFPVSYIIKELDYPVSFERVQRYVWQYYLDNKTLIYLDNETNYREENGIIIIKESNIKKTYVKEQGPYGKTTFRQVTSSEADNTDSNQKSINGRKYVSCDFGILKRNNSKEFENLLNRLDAYDKAYIMDLPWENKIVYHILNDRMLSVKRVNISNLKNIM